MRLPRFFLLSLGLVALLLAGRPAFAQTCAPSTASLTGLGTVTVGPSGLPAHIPGVPSSSINYSDCINDEAFTFNVTMSGPVTSGQLEVWASTGTTNDCGPSSARGSTCWLVAPAQNVSGATSSIVIKARDIVGSMNTASASKPTTYASEQPLSICDTAQTEDAANPITLYFFLANGDSSVCGAEVLYGLIVDLKAGGVVGAPTSSAGNGILIVSFPANQDPDVTKWNVYTDPPPGFVPGDAGSADAGASTCDAAASANVKTATSVGDASEDAEETADAGDAAADDAGSTTCASSSADAGASCPPSSVLLAGGGTATGADGGEELTGGQQRIIPSEYLAGVGDSTATQIILPNGGAKALANDVTYVVAVAAVDAVGNVGPLSLVTVCGASTTPDPNGDFWDQYKAAGGGAGGGFCALGDAGLPVASSSLALVLALLGALAVLARRRRRGVS